MSNPDLPGPYWQDQDNAGYGDDWSGRPNGVPHEASPWEDDAGFWRGNDRAVRAADPPANRAGGGDRDPWWERARPSRGSRRAARGSAGPSDPDWSAAAGSQARHIGDGIDWATADDDAADQGRAAGWRGFWDLDSPDERPGRFSQTADDLRNRLGLRGSAAGRGKRAVGDPVSVDGNQGDFGQVPEAGWSAGSDRGGYRGTRRAGTGAATGLGPYGELDGYDDGAAGSLTALREQPDDWTGDNRTRRGHAVKAPPERSGQGGGGRGGRGGGRGGGWDGDDLTPRTRRERFKEYFRSGDWWRHWTWKKVLGLMGAGVAGFILLGVAAFAIMYTTTSIPTAETSVLKGVSSTVYYSNGKLLATFTDQGTYHQVLSTQEIPKIMNEAIVAAEDRHFYSEGGVSLTGIIRAAKNDLFGGGSLQGASTITEQYVKNYYQSLSSVAGSQSISYKIDEVIVAIKIAHEKPKSWILTQYLDTAPFGPTTYGVGAAAQQYFNVNLTKPGATLTLAQAAMLAAMPNNPAVLSPYPQNSVGYQMLVSRWQYVLNAMAANNAVTQQQANALCANCSLPQAEKAFAKNVKVQPLGSNSGTSGYKYYLRQMVQQELQSTYHLSLHQIETDGLKITTTFSQGMIQQLNRSVTTVKREMKSLGHGFPAYAHVGAVLENPRNGAILAIYGGPGIGVKHCNLLQCWDNSAETPHQAGSSFKPYVLATAVSQGMNTQNSILNGYSPLCVPPDTMPKTLSIVKGQNACLSSLGPTGYWYSSDYSFGAIHPPEAAAVSSNTAFEDLAHRVGDQNILNIAGRFGVGQTEFNLYSQNDLANAEKYFGQNALPPVKGGHQGSITLALGPAGAELTAVEQASTFATLAHDGVYFQPHVISKVMQGSKVLTKPDSPRAVLTPAQAADEDFALSFDNTATYAGATAYPAAYWNRPVIGKTGTTNTAQDAWFIGAIPQYSLAVTMYTNQQNSEANSQSLSVLPNLPNDTAENGGYGGTWSATIWHQFMSTQFTKLPVDQLPPPNFTGFQKWVQVKPKSKKKQVCGGQGPGNGNGNGFGNGHGNKCGNCQHPGFGQPCGNPTPTPTCQGFGQPCGGGPSPTPTPTCQGFGQPCNGSPSPTPTPTATPSPSCSPPIGPVCGPSPGVRAVARNGKVATTALIRPASELTPQQLALKVRQALLSRRQLALA